jgi:hypothetical protein
MTLSEQQNQLIVDIDFRVNLILSKSNCERDILKPLSEVRAEDFKIILQAYEKGKLAAYCQQYKGFYRLVTLLDKIAWRLFKRKPFILY